jgi:hypothetical protein
MPDLTCGDMSVILRQRRISVQAVNWYMQRYFLSSEPPLSVDERDDHKGPLDARITLKIAPESGRR